MIIELKKSTAMFDLILLPAKKRFYGSILPKPLVFLSSILDGSSLYLHRGQYIYICQSINDSRYIYRIPVRDFTPLWFLAYHCAPDNDPVQYDIDILISLVDDSPSQSRYLYASWVPSYIIL